MQGDIFSRIKDQLPLSDFLNNRGYQLERCGSHIYRINPCPLHNCDGNDAFTVFEDSNTYKCFSCGRSGSIFDFLIHIGEASDIAHALQIMADSLHITLEKENTEQAITYKKRLDIWEAAANFYHQQLLTDKKAMEYLHNKRKRSDALINKMNYGYAIGPDRLAKHLSISGYSEEEMLNSGLIRKKEANSPEQSRVGQEAAGNPSTSQSPGFAEGDRCQVPGVRGQRTTPLDPPSVMGVGAEQFPEVNSTQNRLYDLFSGGVLIYPIYYHGKIADFVCKDPQKRPGKDYRLNSQFRNNNVIFYNQEALYKDNVILVEGPEDCNSILELGDYAVVATLGQLQDRQIDLLQQRIKGKVLHIALDKDSPAEKYVRRIAKQMGALEDIRVVEWDPKYKDIDEYLKAMTPLPPSSRGDENIMDSLLNPENETDLIDWLIERTPSVELMSPKMAEGVYQPLLEIISRCTSNVATDRYLRSMSGIFGDIRDIHSLLKRELKRIREGIDDEDDDSYSEVGQKVLLRENNQYYKIDKDLNKKWISNFVLDIKRYVEIDEDMHYEVVLRNSDGHKSKPILLSKQQRINAGEFSATCAGEGSYYYNGTNGDLSYIWISEEHAAKIESRTCYFQRFGYIPKHKVWLFGNCIYKLGKLYVSAEGEDVINVDGIGYKTQHVNVYSGDQPNLYLEKNPSIEYVHQVINLNWQMWDSGKTNTKPYSNFKAFMAMGWLACVIYLYELCQRDRKFAYLLSFGPPGTGKSEAIQLLMNCFGFMNGGENWGESTNAGITDALEQLSSLGYWIEEFSNVVGASATQQRKVEMLKNIYNRASTGKGGLAGKRQAKEVNAAIVMTGQDRPENQALLSRCVVLRKEKPTDAGTEAFYELRSQRQKLSLVVRWLLENKTPDTIKSMYDDIDKLTDYIKVEANKKNIKVDERTAFNLAFFAAGFGVYEFHQYDKKFLEWLVMEAITDSQRKQAEDMVFKFFNDIEVIFPETLYEVVQRIGDTLYLRYDFIYNEWIKNRRTTGMNESLSSGGLHDYMRKDPHEYYITLDKKKNRRYFSGKQFRVIAVSIDKLPSHIKDIVEDWKEAETDMRDV